MTWRPSCSPKEFYEQFKNDPEGARRKALQAGQEMGQILSRKLGVHGGNLETLAAVLNEFMRAEQGEPTAKVEGNKVTMRTSSLSPMMRAAMTLNIPWEWLDTNYACPIFQGIASHIIPDIKLRVPLAGSRGDPAYLFIFER